MSSYWLKTQTAKACASQPWRHRPSFLTLATQRRARMCPACGGAVACFRDVPNANRAAEAALALELDLEDFFENGAVGLHLVSSDGVVLRANRAELKDARL